MDGTAEHAPEFLTHAWGRSEVLYRSPTLKVVRSIARGGGCSSDHCHRRKSHAIICVAGLVLVEYRGGRTTCLSPDDSCVVDASRWHRVSFPRDAEFLEIGYGEAVSRADILRADAGRPGNLPPRRDLRMYDGEG